MATWRPTGSHATQPFSARPSRPAWPNGRASCSTRSSASAAREEAAMKNVTTIIEVTGGWDELRCRPLRLQVPGFMPLVVEAAGTGPRGGTLVSVAHYYEQNGDLMADPEVLFEILGGDWSP